jgi:hypothetical protein
LELASDLSPAGASRAALHASNDLVTDDRAAQQSALLFANKPRFNHDARKWREWTASVWRENRTCLALHFARGLARDLTVSEPDKVRYVTSNAEQHWVAIPVLGGCREHGANCRRTAHRGPALFSVTRLIADSTHIEGALTESHLRRRAVTRCIEFAALRFHPRCPYRDPKTGRFPQLPAFHALFTGLNGKLTGLQRTYPSPTGDGTAKPPALPSIALRNLDSRRAVRRLHRPWRMPNMPMAAAPLPITSLRAP